MGIWKSVTTVTTYFKSLVQANTGISSKSFFLVVTTVFGGILLVVPPIVMLVDLYYHKKIETDLSGLAAYVAAVAGLLAPAGITKAWSEKYETQLPPQETSVEDTEES